MPATVVIGGQWGDEGKGRVVDFFARECTMIGRYSAGSNAGHTIVNERGRFALHLVPAGIFYGDKTCVIGNGVAILPQTLINELSMLEERGVDTSQLLISDRAHVVMPYHKVLDGLEEFREHLGGQLTIPMIKGPGVRLDVHEMQASEVKAAMDELMQRYG